MKVQEILKQNKTVFSFEFYPPKTAKGSENLFNNIKSLSSLEPAYVSVTYGAGGSTRDLTHKLVIKLSKETNLNIVPHLTCISSSEKEISEILDAYREAGINNIMALRGDRPANDSSYEERTEDFKNAADLVRFIRQNYPEFSIGVAGFPEGHPATPNRLTEMDYLKQKVDQGADYICTQLFFDNRDFYDFRERCYISGINIPVIAGIMPITSLKNMRRIGELALGARFPSSLLRALNRADTDQSIKNAGLHWAAEQVRDLLDNDVKGIHFYTLNKADDVKKICSSIGINSSMQL